MKEQKLNCNLPIERSNEVNVVASNLDSVLKSSSYKLAHEDLELLNTNEMRGVRMLLEITKPDLLMQKENILSTVIVFGGVHISEPITSERNLKDAIKLLNKNPKSEHLKRNLQRCKNLFKMSHFYESAREFSRLVSRESKKSKSNQYVIVTGGGPGIMEAANRGAFDEDCKSIGLNISLPNEQHPNSFITPGLCFKFNYFALRKFHFVMRSVAAVFFPGGFGTLDELFEILTLRQTGMKKNIPIILFGKNYWNNVINFSFLSDNGLIDDSHLSIFEYADNAEQAWEIIKRYDKKNK